MYIIVIFSYIHTYTMNKTVQTIYESIIAIYRYRYQFVGLPVCVDFCGGV